MNDDFLDDLLQPPSLEASAKDAARRADLRARTTGVVRWRRYRRRAFQVALAAIFQGVIATAMVACLFASGMITWRQPSQTVATETREAPPVDAPAMEAPSAVALEWQAFDAPADQQADLYFQAGQRYFSDHQDFDSALRCYRQAFASAPKERLAVSPSDNWLVMAIKLDCRKEN
jgi:hypothetical protein